MKNKNVKNTTAILESAEQWRKQAISRSGCYGLLALIFRDTPTSEIITQLRIPPLSETLARLGFDVAQELTGELEAVTQRLAEQYTQSFVGPGPHVSPYASLHCQDDGQLWGQSTVWVKLFIEKTGLSFKDNSDGIPDHIAIELEFMQRLTDHEAQLWASSLSGTSHNKKNVDRSLDQCLQIQEKFLREHLCLWVPQFCERVLEISNSLFYQEMAKLIKLVILSDIEQVTAARNTLRCNSFAG